MYMREINFIYFVILCAVFTLGSCVKTTSYAAEISDLNGTWQPDWSYKATLKKPKEERGENFRLREYSWGEGQIIMHTTFNVDITDDIPFFDAGGDGRFTITDITQIGQSSIKSNAFHGPQDDPHWIVEVIFHFINRNTFWIESKEFGKLDEDYRKGSLWHRISGPVQTE
jgi:hypothetical protein